METYEYIIQDVPTEKNSRGPNQRKLDMVALYYLANLALAGGNPVNTKSEVMIDFFNRKKNFPRTLFSVRIQERLRKINDGWSFYRGSAIIKKIVAFLKKVCLYRLRDNGDRPFDVLTEYYSADQNHEYISVEKLLDDIGNPVKELRACNELDIFFNDLENNTACFEPIYRDYLQKRPN